MSFPASGIEATYRNNVADVAAMLTKQHGDHFMVNIRVHFPPLLRLHRPPLLLFCNLCCVSSWQHLLGLTPTTLVAMLLQIINVAEKSYESENLHNQVLDFGWPDHMAPPLERLCGWVLNLGSCAMCLSVFARCIRRLLPPASNALFLDFFPRLSCAALAGVCRRWMDGIVWMKATWLLCIAKSVHSCKVCTALL